MGTQELFNLLITLSGAVAGWMLKVIWDVIKELRQEVRQLGTEVHADFVRRDDFSDAVMRIERMCEKIFDRLENKADK